MSSVYRYVVFAPGKQPTVKEVDQLQEWSQATKQRYAVGISAEDGALAIAFDARAFETTRSARNRFDRLFRRWEVRGAEIRERLRFIKKPTALQPLPGDLLHDSVEQRSEPLLKHKQLAAQEALGRAGLKFYQTLQQHAWLARVSKAVPYALMGLIAMLAIFAGISVSRRLREAPAERRQETVERVVSDAMEETLARETKNSEE